MTQNEFAKFAMALRTYYPREDKLLPNQEAMKLWMMELNDIPYPVAEAALRKWVQTNKWSPSISDIREMAATVAHGDLPDWGESWEKTLKAVRHYGSYRAKDAVESFDPLTRKCVERIGFLNICRSENIAADRANFRMIYEQLAKREQVKQQVALPLQQKIAQLMLEKADGVLFISGRNEGNKNA